MKIIYKKYFKLIRKNNNKKIIYKLIYNLNINQKQF